MKRLLKNLAFSLLTALALLGGAELALRAVGAARGVDFRAPAPIPTAEPFDVLCKVGGGLVQLCPPPDLEPDRVRQTPFFLEPDRPRVVVIGESFVHGLRLPDGDTWPARLGSHLGPRYEVLNFGRCGSESDSLQYVLDAALRVGASTVVMSIGNNEYTMSPYYAGLPGRYPLAFQTLAEGLSGLRLYGALKHLVSPGTPDYFAMRLAQGAPHPMQRYIDALHRRPADVSVFPNGLADPEITALLEETKRLAERFYRLRMGLMIEKARSRGVQVVLTTMPRALRMTPPLLSGLHGVTREEIEPMALKLQEADLELRGAISDKVLKEVGEAVEGILTRDPKVALALYVHGNRLIRAGRKDQALQVLQMSREWDLVPDATPTINRIIQDLAAQHAVPLLDLQPLSDTHLNDPGALWRDPIHVNARGGEAFGALVARFLLDEGLVPAVSSAAAPVEESPGG